MNANTFMQNFGHLADAPGGVQKLREMVLQLAVHGKLVSQDTDDQPAGCLLDCIESEKKRMLEQRAIKKPIPVPPCDGFEAEGLPVGWIATRIGVCVELISGQHLKPDSYNEDRDGHPYLTGPADFGKVSPTARRWTHEDRALALQGDLLITVKGAGIGKTNVLATPTAFISRQLMSVRPIAIDRNFVHVVLKSRYDRLQRQGVGIAIPGIGRDDIRHLPLWLPPLAEQRRIVAKVDELMALCEELETRQRQRRAVQVALNSAALDRLTTAADPAEFSTAWSRVRHHFDRLYSLPETVTQLRQTILQLAVQGKLVPQNPDDEPASELLDRVAVRKLRLLEAGKIPKPKTTAPISDSVPYELPTKWQWSRLGDISLYIEAGWSPKCESRPRRSKEWGVLKISAVTWGIFNPAENKALPSKSEPRTRCEVKPGDFIMSRANTAELVAKSVVVETTPARLLLNDKLLRVKFPDDIDSRYVNIFNNSLNARDYYESVASGTSVSMRNVSRDNVCNLAVPVPPLAEQRRIVAKVVMLRSLCDELEAKLTQQQADADRLTAAMVAAILNGAAA